MFGNPFGEFQHDSFFDFGAADIPFASRHNQHQQQQQQVTRYRSLQRSDSRNRTRSVPGLPGDFQHQRHHRSQRHADRPAVAGGSALVPFGPAGLASDLPGYYSFGAPQIDRLFEGVNRIMSMAGERMLAAQEASKRSDFDGRIFSHSSVYAYRSDGVGEPHVYQAVSETRAGPGGVRETRKALKDSRSREERIAVGHHIGGRGHTVERRRNTRTGEQQEDHHFDGIDESEGQQFDREWDHRAAQIAFNGRIGGGSGGGRLRDGGRARQRAITDGRH